MKQFITLRQTSDMQAIAPIYYGTSGFAQLKAHFGSQRQYLLVCDSNTRRLCLPLFMEHSSDTPPLFEIAAGEAHKTLHSCEQLWTFALEKGIDRNALWINLGGGLVSDLGGFAAACYKRGVAFVNVPTTLLACVDATAGAKTGINLQAGKNIIGSFYAPEAIFMDTRYLHTLPREEWLSGLAEVLKHGIIADAGYWKLCLTEGMEPERMIRRSVEIKSAIVEADPLEKGMRKILNFGHTLGHALEAAFAQRGIRVTHGACVAAGMWLESLAAEKYAGLSPGQGNEIRSGLAGLFEKLPVSEIDMTDIQKFVMYDKKNQGADIQMSLPDRIGHCLYNIHIPAAEIPQWITAYIQQY